MKINKVLIANRGEIAIRIIRAAAEKGIHSVAVYSEDDINSLHTQKADSVYALDGTGVSAYLDIDSLIDIARQANCDAVHPGYGFLSENPEFARRCAAEKLIFIGPGEETLRLLGDKARARALAEQCQVPVLAGTRTATSLAEAEAFFDDLQTGGAMMIKAIAGGGGRGVRAVHRREDIAEAFVRCESEALQAFGNGGLYVEQMLTCAKHLEVQVIGDGSGAVSHLYERECSLQRRFQKVVEFAPCLDLPAALREKITACALAMAAAVKYRNIGTFEFLVEGDELHEDTPFTFMEANPRLQVEHTVTEEITGVDLVQLQFDLACGHSLSDLGLQQNSIAPPQGAAMQLRINMETLDAGGNTRPSGGVLKAFSPPAGPGIRVDSYGYAGYPCNLRFDSLLGKVIVHINTPDFERLAGKAYRALCEFRIEGVDTNISFLQSLMTHPQLSAEALHTRFIETHGERLFGQPANNHQKLYFDGQTPQPPPATDRSSFDELGDLTDHSVITAPMQATVVAILQEAGNTLHPDQGILIIEAMKMEHVIPAIEGGIIEKIVVAEGDTIREGQPLVVMRPLDAARPTETVVQSVDPDSIRADLAKVLDRHRATADASRGEAIERRHRAGQRSARENIADLCDPGTFVEYGGLVLAAQRRRRSLEDLIERSPADGLVAGLAGVNGELFGEAVSRCVVMAYDYTVFAGTQGINGHEKTDRLLQLAQAARHPVIIFTEGGGGRPGDIDHITASGLNCLSFHHWGKLSGLVPLVGINAGYCFAGNAALLGCCDVIIATENSAIGMGGPAMIEGGGLGSYRPEEVGPSDVNSRNGVIDILVADEAEATRVAKQYLSYFQGSIDHWQCRDQRPLRHIIPENRRRIYNIRDVIDTLADDNSVLELRPGFGRAMVTGLVRVAGRPLGLIANDPAHRGGAINAAEADKAARFMRLCDAFDIPLLFLCDTPGMMVGPEADDAALVRHCSRLFVTGANLSVPFFTIVLRKAYGLGSLAMGGGTFRAPFFVVAWPTGEFGAMGLEGAVKLGFRREMAAIDDPEERRSYYNSVLAQAYDDGSALNTASLFEIDDVIDPAASRDWITAALLSHPATAVAGDRKKHAYIDTW